MTLERFSEQKIIIKLDENEQPTYKKVKLPEEDYHGQFVELRLEQVNAWKSDAKETKIIFNVIITTDKDEHTLSYFVKPTITKGSGTYSNSKLYNLLEKAGLLTELIEKHKDQDPLPKFVNWLDTKIIGRKAKFLVQNRNKGTPEEYSSIGNIIKFL